jgi:hypothetical protein
MAQHASSNGQSNIGNNYTTIISHGLGVTLCARLHKIDWGSIKLADSALWKYLRGTEEQTQRKNEGRTVHGTFHMINALNMASNASSKAANVHCTRLSRGSWRRFARVKRGFLAMYEVTNVRYINKKLHKHVMNVVGCPRTCCLKG